MKVPLTRDLSNLRISKEGFIADAAHEQVHAANRFLTKTFGTPELGEYKSKLLGFIPNHYDVPNKAHPVANEYYWNFMFSPTAHGRFPEETFANYVESQAVGRGSLMTQWDNFDKEGIFIPPGFIEKYQKYLIHKYNPIFRK